MLKSVVGANSVIYRQGVQKQGCCSRHGVKILVVVGLILLVTGVICAITNVFEDWMKDEIREGVTLTEGNDVYDKWLVPETPTYMTYYMFNVTNAEEVSKGGIPNLQQHGPYTYRIDSNKTILSRNKYTSSSITYLKEKHRFFVKELSCDSCDPTRDSFTNVNLPFLSTIEMIIKYIKRQDPSTHSFLLSVVDNIFVKLNLQDFRTLTVHELLWGYEDAALSKAHDILIRSATTFDPTLNIELPKRFALQKNRTISLYTIDSGDDDVDNVGKYLLWNNKPNITCWNDKYANMINGTDGVHYKPFISKDDVIYALVTAVYRSFRLIYDSTVHYRGIRLYRFALAEDQFISGDINGNNKGFCVTGKKKKCLPTGVMDLSHCDPSGAPIVGSLPHFYFGNKSLLNTVNGLNPQKYVHGTFLDIEPHTGITMRGNRRIQINANLRNIEGISAFKSTSTVYLPIMFVNKNGRISEDDADDFKNDVLLPLRLCQAAPFVLFGLGAILLLFAGIISYNRYRKSRYEWDAISEEKIPLILASSENYTELT